MRYVVVVDTGKRGKDRWAWDGFNAQGIRALRDKIKRRYPHALGFSIHQAGSRKYGIYDKGQHRAITKDFLAEFEHIKPLGGKG